MFVLERITINRNYIILLIELTIIVCKSSVRLFTDSGYLAIRVCGHVRSSKCFNVSGLAFPKFSLTRVTGTFCHCTQDFCNMPPGYSDAPDSVPSGYPRPPDTGPGDPAAGGASDVRMVLSFTASLILLALAAARFLSG